MASRVTINELLDAVRQAGDVQPKLPEGDWASTRDVAKQLGMSETTALRRLRILEENGRSERVVVASATGGKITYWRMKENGKK